MKTKRWLLMALAGGGAAAISAASVANMDTYAPLPQGLDSPSSRLEEFCDRHWGTMSPDLSICRFELTHYLDRSAPGDARVRVLPGDIIRVEPSAGVVASVGRKDYASFDAEFMAESEGALRLHAAEGGAGLAARKVRQLRCFRQDGSALRLAPCES